MSGCNNGLPNCITPLPMDASGKMSDYEFLCWVKANMDAFIKEFGDLKTAWDEMREYINNYFQNLDVQQEINNKLDDMLNNGDLETIISKYLTPINPTAFGAVGDGVTNDTQAFISAITYAQNNSRTIRCDSNKRYYLSGVIDCKVSIDFNNSSIVVKNNSYNYNNYILNVIPDSSTDVSFSNAGIVNNSFTLPQLKGKSFALETPLNWKRYGTGDSVYFSQSIITNNNGDCVNSIFNFLPVSGEYTAHNVQPLDTKTITIENVVIDMTGYTDDLYPNVIKISRNNTNLKNVSIKQNLNEYAKFVGSVLYFENCCNCHIERIFGFNPITEGSGYLLQYVCCSNITTNNIILGDFTSTSWAALATIFCTNLSFTDCVSSRFDSHYANQGYFNVYGCTFSRFSYSGGICSYNISNSTIVSLNRQPVMLERDDLPIKLNGNLNIYNCTVYTGIDSDIFFLVNNTNFTNFDNNVVNGKSAVTIKDTTFLGTFNYIVVFESAFEDYMNAYTLIVENISAPTNIVNCREQYPPYNIIIKNIALAANYNIVYGSANNVTFDGLTFPLRTSLMLIPSEYNTLKILNCTFGQLRGPLTHPTFILNNIITTDNPPPAHDTMTSGIINNNVINYTSKLSQSNWNNVIK